MRNPRIIIPALLALAAVLAVLLFPHRRDDDQVPVAGTPPAIDDADAPPQESPAATRPRPDRDAAMFAALRELITGSSDSNCVRAISDAADVVRSNTGAASRKSRDEDWVLAATLRYELGDPVGALSAMQRAVRATAWTWYWPDTIEAVERSLAARTAIPYTDRLSAAFGTAAAGSGLPSVSNVLKMCKAESPSSLAWGEACLAVGTMRAKHPQTEMAGATDLPPIFTGPRHSPR